MKTGIRQVKTIVTSLLFLITSQVIHGRPATDPIGSSAQVERLQQEIQRFNEIDRKGGWQKITLQKKQYKKGEAAPVIRQLKKRLQLSGDLSEKDTSSLFTPELEAAVKKAQRRFGFPQSGVVEASFVLTLNVPVEKRLQQLQANLYRVQTSHAGSSGQRIVVNIPEYKLHVYQDGQHLFEMNVVVGKESSRTEVFNDELTHVVFSPYWNVPASIVQNEILPAMRKNRRYLAVNGYEKTGTENGLPKIRQKPGRNNSLGLVKFLFPNEHDIYFHDTPAKSLFKNRVRAYSHGCIRLEEPAKLAAYLLQGSPDWTSMKIDEAMNAGSEQWVKLPTPVSVSISYYTAWVDHEGELNFRDDIYGLDKDLPVATAAR